MYPLNTMPIGELLRRTSASHQVSRYTQIVDSERVDVMKIHKYLHNVSNEIWKLFIELDLFIIFLDFFGKVFALKLEAVQFTPHTLHLIVQKSRPRIDFVGRQSQDVFSQQALNILVNLHFRSTCFRRHCLKSTTGVEVEVCGLRDVFLTSMKTNRFAAIVLHPDPTGPGFALLLQHRS
jgi:hypothetical protein